jgi:hypothetical protein
MQRHPWRLIRHLTPGSGRKPGPLCPQFHNQPSGGLGGELQAQGVVQSLGTDRIRLSDDEDTAASSQLGPRPLQRRGRPATRFGIGACDESQFRPYLGGQFVEHSWPWPEQLGGGWQAG